MATNLTIPQGMDAGAVNLARSIRQQEGGDYNNYSGDGGTSAGAYQWNNGSIKLQPGQIPANFQSDAKQFGLDPSDFSPKNQDMVAYNKIKSEKDKGLNVLQIASSWNAGAGEPNAYTGKFSNGQPSVVPGKYDVPTYVKNVNNTYQSLKEKTQLDNGLNTGGLTSANTINPSASSGDQRSQLESQGQPVSINPNKAQPSFLGGAIRDVIHPFVSGATNLINAGQDLIGKPETSPLSGSYLGNVQRIGSGFDVTKGLTPENLSAIGDAAKQGLGAATTIAGGEGLLGLGKTVAEEGLGGLTKGLLSNFTGKSVSEEAQAVLQQYAKDTGSAISDLSAKEKFNAITEAAQTADPATRQILQKDAQQALAQVMKEAGIGSWSELNPIKAKAIGITKKAIGFALAGAGIDLGWNKLKGLLKNL